MFFGTLSYLFKCCGSVFLLVKRVVVRNNSLEALDRFSAQQVETAQMAGGGGGDSVQGSHHELEAEEGSK